VHKSSVRGSDGGPDGGANGPSLAVSIKR